MHLLEVQGMRILLDCGLSYEKLESGEPESNMHFPFNPASIDVVILSHAHIDHSGNIPNLVRQGFKGAIYCTKATKELVHDLWLDSLNIQQLESRKSKGKKGRRKEILYSFPHVTESLELMKVMPYQSHFELNKSGMSAVFYQAGHIPGAASVSLSINEGAEQINLGFTGDIGNFNSALVADPVPMKNLNYLISESTYGNRNHSGVESRQASLLRHMKEVCIKRKGKLVIPAFSIGRTQAILYTLHELYKQGEVPAWLNIYTDSPLAIKSTQVYRNNLEILNPEAQHFHQRYGDLFRFENLKVLVEPAQSDFVSQSEESCIIVSAAGMLEGGRIQKHVRNNISISRNRILIAGYCAEGTLGDRLLQGQDYVRINRRERIVRAEVQKTDAFSAHADQKGLMKYIQNVNDSGDLKRIFLVHGDPESMEALREKVSPIQEVVIPQKAEKYIIN